MKKFNRIMRKIIIAILIASAVVMMLALIGVLVFKLNLPDFILYNLVGLGTVSFCGCAIVFLLIANVLLNDNIPEMDDEQ